MTTKHLVFCLQPDHASFGLVSALEVLRHANRLHGTPAYRWSFVTETNESVKDSNGLPLQPTCDIEKVKQVDQIYVVAGFNAESMECPQTVALLKRQALANVAVGGISNGGFIVAAAGLLNGYQATVHWEDFAGFCALFPSVNARYQRFVIDRDRLTCSGGAATLDLFIEIVRQDLGNEIASRVARQMLLQDFSPVIDVTGRHIFEGTHRYSASVQRALSLIDAGLDQGISVSSLAQRVGISSRELLRLFRKEIGYTPVQLLNQRRLERARSLVRHSHLPLIKISNATGYSSQSHFTKSYRESYGVTPAKDRARGSIESNDK